IACAVGLITARVSNMKAMVSLITSGFDRSAFEAFSKVAASGPCPLMQLCSDAPPGTKPSALASYTPAIRPMNSLATLRWNQGGRKVSCATSQRGGKMAKSRFAVPGTPLGEVSTVKIDGSGWSKLIEPMVLKRRRSYLRGAYLRRHPTTAGGEWPIGPCHRRPWNFAISEKDPSTSSN